MELLMDPSIWAGLLTLVVLEIVLGIDNLVFIAILADKLPPKQRDKARLIGLSLALIMRLGLLSVISWMVTLTAPLFSVWDYSFSGRDLIMLLGGLFLLFKATTELHERLENRQHDAGHGKGYASFWVVVLQIVVLDAGRVAQVGKPLELYHYPADRFVAGFIGSPKMNFLPVKVTATAIDQVQVELPNRQQIWLPVDSHAVQVGANMSLGIRPEHLLPSDIADVTLEGEVQVVEQLGHETQIHIQIPAIRQNLVYRQNDVVLVEEGATFAIGLPPERCHLFREDGTACRRLHQEPGV